MHLIQIYLPLTDNAGISIPSARFASVRETLTQKFGGLTAFTRSPADGLWESDSTEVRRDRIVIFEVLVGSVVTTWWKEYRAHLEREFEQELIQILVQEVRQL